MSAEPLKLKSLPDPAKILAMADPRISVYKRQKGSGNNRMIRNGISISKVDDVYKIMDDVHLKEGPGGYEFTVADAEGGETDKWGCMFGTALDAEGMNDAMNPMNVVPIAGNGNVGGMGGAGTAFGATPGAPMHIGNGFILTLFPHDPTKGLLTTPQRTIIEWSQGMQLPGVLGGGGFGGGSSPVPQQSMGIPMTPAPGESPLMDLLRTEREQRKEQEMRAEFRSVLDQTTKRYEELLEKLSTNKNTGPSPEVEALKAALAASEKRHEEDKREAEARRRDDSMRAEIAATNARMETMMREVTNHKPDPMGPLSSLLTQIMATNQQGTQALMAAMDKATTVQAHASEESTRALAARIMAPEKFMELLTIAKDKGPEHAILLDGVGKMWTMMQDVVRLQRDTGDPGEPAWVGMLQRGIEQIGGLGQAYLARPVGTQPAAPPRPRPVVVQQPMRAADGPQGNQPIQQGPMSPPTPIRPVDPNDPNAIKEAVAAQVFGKANENARPVSVSPDVVLPPGTTAEKVQQAYTELGQATPDAVRALVAETPDNVFFGSVWQQIGLLRNAVAADQVDADDIVKAILGAQEILHKSNEFPQAMELLKVGQLQVLVERLLPDEVDDEEFIQEVIAALKEKLPS